VSLHWRAIKKHAYWSMKVVITELRTWVAASLWTWPVLLNSDTQLALSVSPLSNHSELMRLFRRFRSVPAEIVPRRLSLYFGNSLYSTEHTIKHQLQSQLKIYITSNTLLLLCHQNKSLWGLFETVTVAS